MHFCQRPSLHDYDRLLIVVLFLVHVTVSVCLNLYDQCRTYHHLNYNALPSVVTLPNSSNE